MASCTIFYSIKKARIVASKSVITIFSGNVNFLAYCCDSTLVFLNHLEDRHTYLYPLAHPNTRSNTSPNIFIKQSNCTDPRQLYVGLYSVYLELNSVCLFVQAPWDNARLLFGWHGFTLWRGRYIYGAGRIIIIKNLVWSYVWLEKCDLKSSDKHNRYKQHKQTFFL